MQLSRTVKRVLLTMGACALAIVLVLGAGIAEMFVGLSSVVDGVEIQGMRVLADGFTTMIVIPTGPGEVALIDGGMDATGAALKTELARRKLKLDAVKAVLLTHGHADHIGTIPILPSAQVMALDAEAPIAEGTQAPLSPMGRLMPVNPTGIRITRRLRDGETVNLGTASIRVYAVPGHTAGSAAYVANGVLFLGDSAQITTDGEIRPAPWLVTDNRAQNRESLIRLHQRLTADAVQLAGIVPSHSGLSQGGTALALFAAANSD